MGRLGIGIELKPAYYGQAVKNVQAVDKPSFEQEILPGFSDSVLAGLD
jgi:hypothetical protein